MVLAPRSKERLVEMGARVVVRDVLLLPFVAVRSAGGRTDRCFYSSMANHTEHCLKCYGNQSYLARSCLLW